MNLGRFFSFSMHIFISLLIRIGILNSSYFSQYEKKFTLKYWKDGYL